MLELFLDYPRESTQRLPLSFRPTGASANAFLAHVKYQKFNMLAAFAIPMLPTRYIVNATPMDWCWCETLALL